MVEVRDTHRIKHTWLVVLGRYHGADSIEAGSQATIDGCFQQALAIACVIDTFEEGEGGWIRGRCGVERAAEILYGDVTVSNDLAIAIQVLRGAIIGGRWVGEGTSLQTLCLDSDGEGGIGRNLLAKLGLHEDGADHVRGRWNLTHRNAVAGSIGELSTIGELGTGAEVDEVVRVPGRSVSP